MNKLIAKLTLSFIFAISMAFLEAAVVIYLRDIYYPEGFAFPLVDLTIFHFIIELCREFSTIIMLLIVAIILGKGIYEKGFYFLFLFGIWDIFYYVFLKITLNWPLSFFTWDILFLIPVIWASPVLAPVIISITIVSISSFGLYLISKGIEIELSKTDIFLIFSSILIIFISFILPFSKIANGEAPIIYHWEIFFTAELIIIFVFVNNCLKVFNRKRI